MKRTQLEITSEIEALKKLKPLGRWAENTKNMIEETIGALEHGYDQTSEEWEELPEQIQSTIQEALNWKDRHTEEKPSESFTGLAE